MNNRQTQVSGNLAIGVFALLVLKCKIVSNFLSSLSGTFVFFEINFFVFDGAPKSFRNDVV
ncbi:hypothetical protein [Virgibacillus pantothenticus]|uniref:hypothetical protein n=1 Tax=Virgibacillus pantothenticus TaxID=1473 RepID=UPI0009F96631|nr:hypothetical protein [Virgibacillus pantothenticus]